MQQPQNNDFVLVTHTSDYKETEDVVSAYLIPSLV